MPHVRKVLEAVIWRWDIKRDFMPIGSEQPEEFEYAVRQEVKTVRQTETDRPQRSDQPCNATLGTIGAIPPPGGMKAVQPLRNRQISPTSADLPQQKCS